MRPNPGEYREQDRACFDARESVIGILRPAGGKAPRPDAHMSIKERQV
jgi:hypothetical protein